MWKNSTKYGRKGTEKIQHTVSSVESRFYEADYNNITRKLLYEDVSYETAIEKGIAIVAEKGVF